MAGVIYQLRLMANWSDHPFGYVSKPTLPLTTEEIIRRSRADRTSVFGRREPAMAGQHEGFRRHHDHSDPRGSAAGHRGHQNWPDFIEFEAEEHTAQLVWFGDKRITYDTEQIELLRRQ